MLTGEACLLLVTRGKCGEHEDRSAATGQDSRASDEIRAGSKELS